MEWFTFGGHHRSTKLRRCSSLGKELNSVASQTPHGSTLFGVGLLQSIHPGPWPGVASCRAGGAAARSGGSDRLLRHVGVQAGRAPLRDRHCRDNNHYGDARDDYGLSRLWFEYQLNQSTSANRRAIHARFPARDTHRHCSAQPMGSRGLHYGRRLGATRSQQSACD